MKPELCDYMCGHESKSGTGARYGKRKVPVLARQMALFPRFKVPALNKPRAPRVSAGRGRRSRPTLPPGRQGDRRARTRLGPDLPKPLARYQSLAKNVRIELDNGLESH